MKTALTSAAWLAVVALTGLASCAPASELDQEQTEVAPGAVNPGLRAAFAATRSSDVPPPREARLLNAVDCGGELPGLSLSDNNIVSITCPTGPHGRVAMRVICKGPPTKAKMYADGRFYVECPEETARWARHRAEIAARTKAGAGGRAQQSGL